jgi:hypothetical protein
MCPSRLLLPAVVSLSVLVAACGGLRTAARYEGREAPSLVSPHELGLVSALPDGYDRLGRISARCTLDEGARAIDGEWLSDVDCSERRLVGAIREKAADAGAELLVGLRCFSRGSGRIDIVCRADLARPNDETLEQRVMAARRAPPLTEREPASAEAWRIKVHFTPNPGVVPRTARRADLIREVPHFPVSHVRLGDVVTVCERGCSLDAVRDAVLVAAARVGATDVVELHCAGQGDGWICAGTAAAYELEPELETRAR